MIGKLRGESGQRPAHPRARALVAQLDRSSELFPRVWRQHEISTCVQGVKILKHRLGGALRMHSEAATIHSSPGQVFYTMLPVDKAFETAYRKHAADHPAGFWEPDTRYRPDGVPAGGLPDVL